MTNAQWIRPLSHFIEYPNTSPVCPAVCPFCRYCSDWVQRGIARGLVVGQIESHHGCLFYEGLMVLCRETFGLEPESADHFLELVHERAGMDLDPARP